MKRIVVYTSKTGFTATYAKWIAQELDCAAKELKGIDIAHLTPMDALNTLYRLQNKLKNRW